MANEAENVLTYRSLYAGAVLSVHDYHCRAGRGGPAEEEFAEENQIVLMRRGMFCRHFGKCSVGADSNQVVFFTKGSNYRVSHPSDCGDQGTILSPSPELLRDIVEQLAPQLAVNSEVAFPFAIGPCSSEVFLKHRQLVQHLERKLLRSAQSDLIDLEIEEASILILEQALSAALAQGGANTKRRSSSATKLAHEEQVQEAKSYLSKNLGEQISLEKVAQAARVSPFHLSRLFKTSTGISLHQYLIQLRLRESLELLCQGSSDLSTMALNLGFSSPSHFSEAFRREFKCSPSSLKRDINLISDLSKNLKV